jgi:hypothetical protein
VIEEQSLTKRLAKPVAAGLARQYDHDDVWNRDAIVAFNVFGAQRGRRILHVRVEEARQLDCAYCHNRNRCHARYETRRSFIGIKSAGLRCFQHQCLHRPPCN